MNISVIPQNVNLPIFMGFHAIGTGQYLVFGDGHPKSRTPHKSTLMARNTRILAFVILIASASSDAHTQTWSRVGSPGAGGVYSLANEGDTIYAGTQYVLIRSTDLGDTWTAADNGLPVATLPLCMTVGGGSIFVGVSSPTSNGVFRSTDHGGTWTEASNGFPLGSYVRDVKYHRGKLFAATVSTLGSTAGGLYISTNNGDSWAEVADGPDTNMLSVAALGDTIYAGSTLSTIYISTDLGQTWWDTTVVPFFGQSIDRILPAPPYLFVSASGRGVYRSSDGGRTWLERNDGINLGAILSKPLERIGDTLFVGIDNGGAQPCGGIWRSTNNGDSWVQSSTYRMTRVLGTCIDTAYYLTTALLARNHTLFAGSFGFGVFRSTDTGTSWKQVAAPIQSYGQTVLAQRGDTLYAGGTDGGGLFMSLDNGNHWDQFMYELHGSVTSIVPSGQFLFAGQAYGAGVVRSSNGGQTWTRSTAGPTNTVNCMSESGGILYAGTDGGLYASTNAGGTWTQTAYTTPANNLLAKGNVILVNRAEFGTQRTFRSTDGGASFDTVAGGLPAGFVARDYLTAGNRIIALGIAVGSGSVFSSVDDGATWTNISGPLTAAYCHALAGDTLFVSGSIGASVVLRRTTDFGQTWTVVSTAGLSNGAFEDLAWKNGYLFGVRGVGQSGVWRIQLSGTVGVDETDTPLPRDIALDQNFPNPFNPATTITYHLPSSGVVSLRVYDLLGREIATLVDGPAGAGTHQIQWNATQMPTGVYLVRLSTPSGAFTRRMMLVK